MAEKDAHRRAKNKAAGARGKTEVPLPGHQRLDALTSGGGRATEVSVAARLGDSRRPRSV